MSKIVKLIKEKYNKFQQKRKKIKEINEQFSEIENHWKDVCSSPEGRRLIDEYKQQKRHH